MSAEENPAPSSDAPATSSAVTTTTPVPPAPATSFTVPVGPSPNLAFAIVGGLVASIAGAALWAVITVSTGMQIGYMSVGVGLLVGFAMRYAGHGAGPVFGIFGAAFALFGCMLGNVLSAVGFFSTQNNAPFFDVLGSITFSTAMNILTEGFQPLDILFYGLAIWCGYRYCGGLAQRTA